MNLQLSPVLCPKCAKAPKPHKAYMVPIKIETDDFPIDPANLYKNPPVNSTIKITWKCTCPECDYEVT